MKRIFLLLVNLLLIFTLFACSKETSQQEKLDKVTIASIGSDVDIWKFIAKSDVAKQANLDIEVKEISGGLQTNLVVAEGSIDVNAFQSYGYFASFNRESNKKLVAIATTYYEPMGIYSAKFKNISEIPDESTLAIPNDPANEARALRVLEGAGLIKLTDNFDDGLGSIKDIIENQHKFKFKTIEDRMSPRILPDVDAAVIGNTIALKGGLNVLTDSLYKEEISDKNKQIINLLATSPDKQHNPALLKLGPLFQSEEVKQFIAKNFGGTKIQIDKPISYLTE